MNPFLEAVKKQAETLYASIEKVINTVQSPLVELTEEDKEYLLSIRTDLMAKYSQLNARVNKLAEDHDKVQASLDAHETVLNDLESVIENIELVLDER